MTLEFVSLFKNIKGYYLGTQEEIEALTGLEEGSIGYATDIDSPGSYDGTVWAWGTAADVAAAISAATYEDTPDVADLIPFVTAVGGDLQKVDFEAFLENIIVPSVEGLFVPSSGWIEAVETWTFASADDPVYQIYVSGNVSSRPDYKVGNRVKCTNNSTTFYGMIVKVGSYDAGNNRTPVDIYGGTDYDLANLAITAPSLSNIKIPHGFPMDPDKWTVSLSDTSDRSQASPTASTWYNLGSLSLDIPIGKWRVYYELAIQFTVTLAAAQNRGFQSTLSTVNNAESDSAFTASYTFALPVITGGVGRATVHREKPLSLTSKTTYYLLGLAGGSTTATSLNFRGDVLATTVRCECAYL